MLPTARPGSPGQAPGASRGPAQSSTVTSTGHAPGPVASSGDAEGIWAVAQGSLCTLLPVGSFLALLKTFLSLRTRTSNLLILRVISVHFLTCGDGGEAPTLKFSYFWTPRNPHLTLEPKGMQAIATAPDSPSQLQGQREHASSPAEIGGAGPIPTGTS